MPRPCEAQMDQRSAKPLQVVEERRNRSDLRREEIGVT